MSGKKNFTKRELIEQFASKTNNENAKLAMAYIFNILQLRSEHVDDDVQNKLLSSLKALAASGEKRWEKAKRTKDRYESQNQEWLDSLFVMPEGLVVDQSPQQASGSGGRPSLPFAESSERSRRRHASALKETEPETDKLVMAGAMAARSEKRFDLAKILAEAAKSPNRPTKMRRMLFQPMEKPQAYSPDEALALLIDCDFSKSQFMRLRMGLKQKSADVFPRYELLLQSKLAAMPPKHSISIANNGERAEVQLQSLLDHTAFRIATLNSDVILAHMNLKSADALPVELICIWGLDAATGHSIYSQKESQEITSLLAVSMVPLRLVRGNDVLWINRTPQSYRYCRPICLSFVKETDEVVKAETSKIEAQIQKLSECSISLSSKHTTQVSYRMFLTMIDGKILSHLTGTSSMQVCPVCKAKPTMFNNLANVTNGVFTPEAAALQFGVSPLHCWIRFLECCLNISYRLDFKKWQAKGPVLQKSKKDRQKLVGDLLKKEMGLIVDKVRQNGSGTSNTGNTARRAFTDYSTFAQITGLDEELIKNFKIILISLSCQLPINPILFGELCSKTAEIYVQNYNWFYMPSSIHKILMHGAQILAHSILPVGVMSEEAGESRHKYFRRDREIHSRKRRPQETMEDIFYRALQSSDPIISNFSLESRLKKKKSLALPREVVEMLLLPEEPEQMDISDEADEDDDGTGLLEVFKLLENLTLDTEEIE